MRLFSTPSCNSHSRRRALGWIGTLALAPFVGACAALGLTKSTKQEANYRDMPNNGQRCAGCVHFIAPNACSRVEGQISPDGWCMFWSGRSG
jgi:hypothetical protein